MIPMNPLGMSPRKTHRGKRSRGKGKPMMAAGDAMQAAHAAHSAGDHDTARKHLFTALSGLKRAAPKAPAMPMAPTETQPMMAPAMPMPKSMPDESKGRKQRLAGMLKSRKPKL